MASPSEFITTEALFYRAYNCYLLQKPHFKEAFKLLCFQYTEHPETFKALGKKNVLRIKQMQEDITQDRYSLFSGNLNFESSLDEIREKRSEKKHKDICHALLKNKEALLEPHTGPISSANFEHPVPYGNIDLFVQGGSCAYIVEVKTTTTDHAIIGQVMKYYIGLSLKLNLKLYDEVQIITVCPGYDKPALLGLKQIGACPLVLKSKPLSTHKV